ncbi:MAG TPA: hypothetical protein VFT20_14010, partial [Candidatus Limnocylindrales bacterium]|nr:hypothetical protein [Candidatus Limnocylindrales bacterium]
MSPWASLTAPISALPLDVVRLLVGCLAFAYFARTYREAPLFSGPDGLLDHALLRRMFPFTRMSVFPAGMTLSGLRAAYAGGCACAILLATGIGGQPVALVLYILVVSTYRWNFLLMYIDDAVMHLVLFWMCLLPIGTTLTLPAFVADPQGSWAA